MGRRDVTCRADKLSSLHLFFRQWDSVRFPHIEVDDLGLALIVHCLSSLPSRSDQLSDCASSSDRPPRVRAHVD